MKAKSSIAPFQSAYCFNNSLLEQHCNLMPIYRIAAANNTNVVKSGVQCYIWDNNAVSAAVNLGDIGPHGANFIDLNFAAVITAYFTWTEKYGAVSVKLAAISDFAAPPGANWVLAKFGTLGEFPKLPKDFEYASISIAAGELSKRSAVRSLPAKKS